MLFIKFFKVKKPKLTKFASCLAAHSSCLNNLVNKSQEQHVFHPNIMAVNDAN